MDKNKQGNAKEKKQKYSKAASEIKLNVTELVKKSDLNAKNDYEYTKISRKHERFLDCSYSEGKETVTFEYNIEYKKNWKNIKQEGRNLIIQALVDVGGIIDLAQDYVFGINPENLFYDIHGRVYIKTRDIYPSEESFSYEDFLKAYKALIGCTIGKKYKYEDYLMGGMDLLKEDAVLKQIFEIDDLAAIEQLLRDELDRYNQNQAIRYIKVDRKKNRTKNALLVASILLLVATFSYAVYFAAWVKPYQTAVISANEAYLVSDYKGVIDALDDVKVSRMNNYQKYILAISSIRCESFGADAMKNILAMVNTNSDEKIMEYWIYINRLNTDKAQDIAMQLSNDQLLYYAYLKEKAVVSNDYKMSGEQKNQKLSELDSKLKPLEDEYSKLIEETEETEKE